MDGWNGDFHGGGKLSEPRYHSLWLQVKVRSASFCTSTSFCRLTFTALICTLPNMTTSQFLSSDDKWRPIPNLNFQERESARLDWEPIGLVSKEKLLKLSFFSFFILDQSLKQCCIIKIWLWRPIPVAVFRKEGLWRLRIVSTIILY